MHKAKANLRSFICNEGNRKLTFVCSLVTAFLCLFPFASSYLDAHSERLDVSSKAEQLENLQNSVAELKEERTSLESTVKKMRGKLVAENEVETFRNRIVEIVRHSNCHLRNITLGERTQRPWMEQDDVLSDGNDDQDFEEDPTEYSVQTQKLGLSVTGPFDDIRTLMQAVQEIEKFLHTTELDIHSGNDSEISIQWELALIGFVYTPQEDDYDWEEE